MPTANVKAAAALPSPIASDRPPAMSVRSRYPQLVGAQCQARVDRGEWVRLGDRQRRRHPRGGRPDRRHHQVLLAEHTLVVDPLLTCVGARLPERVKVGLLLADLLPLGLDREVEQLDPVGGLQERELLGVVAVPSGEQLVIGLEVRRAAASSPLRNK